MFGSLLGQGLFRMLCSFLLLSFIIKYILEPSEPFDPSKIRELKYRNIANENGTNVHYKCVVPGKEIQPILAHLVPIEKKYQGAFCAGSGDAKLDYDGKEIDIHWSDIKMRPKIVLLVNVDGWWGKMLDEPYGEQFLDVINKYYEKDDSANGLHQVENKVNN